jgi:multiple sugar transport system ATP-binding protein
MDEPLSNLDAKLRVQMRTEIARLQHRLGTTTVYVTHDQTEAMTLGDRVAVMRKGVVQQVGSPRELYNDPANLFVAGFIGSPAMNLLPGEVDGRRLSFPLAELELPAETTERLGAGTRRVIAGIRPENFEDAALVGDARPHGTTFQASIDVIEWMGSELYAYFRVSEGAAGELAQLADLEPVDGPGRDGTEIVARLGSASQAKAGHDHDLWVDARHVHLFDPDTGEALTRRNDEASP